MNFGQHSATCHKVTRILNYSFLFLGGGEMLWMVKWSVIQRSENQQLLYGTKPCTVARVESKATKARKGSRCPENLTRYSHTAEKITCLQTLRGRMTPQKVWRIGFNCEKISCLSRKQRQNKTNNDKIKEKKKPHRARQWVTEWVNVKSRNTSASPSRAREASHGVAGCRREPSLGRWGGSSTLHGQMRPYSLLVPPSRLHPLTAAWMSTLVSDR